MNEVEQSSSGQPGTDVSAPRFLRIFAVTVVVAAAIVASINLVAFRFMLKPDNQDVVQLLSGWGRIYKPILYDEFAPSVAVYGASWARDAFDPIEAGALLGTSLFNHAVSGGTAYETRRFVDSSLDNPNLRAAIVNLDSFLRGETLARVRYGFDESLLDVDAERNPNRWAGVSRAYSLTLAGWAIGTNLELVSALVARDGGAARPDYLRSYERANLTLKQADMEAAKRRVFPEPGRGVDVADGQPVNTFSPDAVVELEHVIDRFCGSGVNVYAYFNPYHVGQYPCDPEARTELVTLDFLRRKQRECAATIRYFDFDYPNPVTLEGVLEPVVFSRYFRPDYHPRPSVGLLMAARMFDREFPDGTPPAVQRDFGTELLSHEAAQDWLRSRAARCRGDWGEAGYGSFLAALGPR